VNANLEAICLLDRPVGRFDEPLATEGNSIALCGWPVQGKYIHEIAASRQLESFLLLALKETL
jgi:hypothetical protein